jgi:hypothetical protein
VGACTLWLVEAINNHCKTEVPTVCNVPIRYVQVACTPC